LRQSRKRPGSARGQDPAPAFSLECRECPRLAGFLERCRHDHPDYHARPVAPFGVARPRLLVVGLAPGMHGANRSGRPFTGDYAGVLLYASLHRHGFASAPESVHRQDGLKLIACRITNAVKCVPPANKPTPAEIRQCNGYLRTELAGLPQDTVILALGRIAHEATLRALDLRVAAYPFAHGAQHALPEGRRLFDSYHCSRYNVNTRRLTAGMFDKVIAAIAGAVAPS
jgi:uracil-DNA glycosylase family 4